MRRNPPAKWTLPDVVNPSDRLCVRIEIPNNVLHIAAFRGALLTLASGYNWQDDTSHTAKDVARVWRQIVDAVTFIECNPVPTSEGRGGGVILPMFRQNPSNPCQLEVSLGNDCWCVIFDASLCNPNPTQPGATEEPNSRRPEPGKAKEECYTLQANGYLNLPFTVSTGDVLEVTSASGAGWDGNPLRSWACPDGGVYFAGSCSGRQIPSGTDPIPSIAHMRLIWNIGGTAYDAMGGPVTVSGGDNQQVTLSVNDSNIGDNSGSYQVCVKLTSGAAVGFTHTFDFTVTEGGFVTPTINSPASGLWTPGAGWVDTNWVYTGNGNQYHGVDITRAMSTRTVTRIEIIGDRTPGNVPSGRTDAWLDIIIGGTTVKQVTVDVDNASGAGLDYVWSGSQSGNSIEIVWNDTIANASPQGSGVLKKVIVTGLGTDPF